MASTGYNGGKGCAKTCITIARGVAGQLQVPALCLFPIAYGVAYGFTFKIHCLQGLSFKRRNGRALEERTQVVPYFDKS